VRTVLLYLATTAVALTLAVSAAVLIGPGRGFDLPTDLSFSAPASVRSRTCWSTSSRATPSRP
jgi:Na+/H+-dicarboxylate symporter